MSSPHPAVPAPALPAALGWGARFPSARPPARPRNSWFDLDQERALRLVSQALRRDAQRPVLHVGCGTSVWCEALQGMLGRRVVHLDRSRRAVDAVRRRLGPRAAVVEADCMALPFADCHFGAVVDKGTLDAFLNGAPPQHLAADMCREVGRVLAPSGLYLQVSTDQPEARVELLGNLFAGAAAANGSDSEETTARPSASWDVSWQDVSDPAAQFEGFLYVVTRSPPQPSP